MARTYLFFRPLRLPLSSQDLNAETVLPLNDAVYVRSSLERMLPAIAWEGGSIGRAEFEGKWLEFSLGSEGDTLSMRCSLRADYEPVVQRLCDELGWLAFDEQPLCYQPHRPPVPA